MNTFFEYLSKPLESMLQNRPHKVNSLSEDNMPLFMLLDIGPDLVGFAAIEDNPQEDFETAFHNFKSLFIKNTDQWSKQDLSLVLCKTSAEKSLDNIFDKIEKNPYFCKKYIIDFTNLDESVFYDELKKLPFLPMKSIMDKETSTMFFERPFSAQFLLQKFNVSATLARFIVTQGERSNVGIINDCLREKLGPPEWKEIKLDDPQSKLEDRKPIVRLLEIEINDFRAYAGKHKFNLDADLVVLYGLNGLGKTSFFDALDFACTGGIGRFDNRKIKGARLNEMLKHLDVSSSDKEKSFVKLTTTIDNKKVTIYRTVDDKTKAKIIDTTYNRLSTLIKLTGIDQGSIDTRTENLIRLFRSTHLFGQDFQTLTTEFKNHSTLNKATVSRMLALQDYVEGIKKAGEVIWEISKNISRGKENIASLKLNKKTKGEEFKNLKESSKALGSPKVIDKRGRDLVQKINKAIDQEIPTPKKINQVTVRGWRSILEQQVKSISNQLELISNLELKYSDFVSHVKSYKKNKKKLDKDIHEWTELKEKHYKDRKRINNLNIQYKTLITEKKNIADKISNLTWLQEKSVDFIMLNNQASKEQQNIQSHQNDLVKLLPELEKLNIEVENKLEFINKSTNEINRLESDLSELEKFSKTINEVYMLFEYERTLVKKQKIGNNEINTQRKKLKDIEVDYNNAKINEKRLKVHLNRLQESQSELLTLLDGIEKHIKSDTCPVCNTQHSSIEELKRKLKIQKKLQPAQLKEIVELHKKADEKRIKAEKLIEELEQKINQEKLIADQITIEIEDLKIKFKSFKEISKGLNIEFNKATLRENVKSRKVEILSQISLSKKELTSLSEASIDLNKKIKTIINKKGEKEKAIKVAETKVKQLSNIVEKIKSEAERRKVSLEKSKGKTGSELNTYKAILNKKILEVESKQEELNKFQKKLRMISDKLEAFESEIPLIERDLKKSKKITEEFEQQAKRLELDIDGGKDEILSKKELLTKVINDLKSLRSEVTNFELALDAAQISARLAVVKQEADSIEEEIKRLTGQMKKLEDWVGFFEKIQNGLSSNRNRYLKQYTDNYGPLATLIQSRLRTVYGFGELKIKSEEGGIVVKVGRKDQGSYYPSDYFSESQTQIVMLSLFLSASITQSWSNFAPIILDDPITHFDDINAYSFINLIRGIIDNSDEKNQFIISTCDERLYQSMRQKFSKIGGTVIFYEFKSIGEKGPEVEMIS